MRVTASVLPEVLIVEPDRHDDDRGFFMETYRVDRYVEAGIAETFVQDNLSLSRAGVLRGLHLQSPDGQGKLVSVLAGAVFDVALDVRRGSPTRGRWSSIELSADNGLQVWIPEGFAHGFCVLRGDARVAYKATRAYDPAGAITIKWNDPALGIDWPIAAPVLSAAGAAAPPLANIDPARLPAWRDPAR